MARTTTSAGRLARHAGSGAGRAARAWRTLSPDRRLAAWAALGLFLALFLPWYQDTVIATSTGATLQSQSVTLTGWGAFSFVEASVLLVAAGVLTLLFQRAEGRAFHLPGGDGWVIMAAGLWTCLLIVWRMFDKQGTTQHGQYADASGIEWGIFIALAVAALLAYAGARIRAAHQPEPPLPGDDAAAEPWVTGRERPARSGATPRPVATPRPIAAAGPIAAEDHRKRTAATDDATRVSRRSPANDLPTRVSKREQPTRVSKRDQPTPVASRKPPDAQPRRDETAEQSPSERPTRHFGPPVVPEDPPTLEYQRKRAPIVPKLPDDGK